MPAPRRPRPGTLAAAVRSLLALGAIFGAIALLGSCAGERPSLGSIAPTSTTAPATTSTTATSTTTTVAEDPDDGVLGPDDLLGYIATPKGDPEVFDAPADDATDLDLPAETPAGAPTTFAVVGDASTSAVLPHPGWYEVALPTKPNGSTGWVRASSVGIGKTPFRIFVDLEGRTLRVEKDLLSVFETEVAIGTEENPTPENGTYVTELIDNTNPGGAYGPYAFGLAMHSPTATDFGGGDGQVGIHGTNKPELIGQRVSHGCVRLENGQIEALVDLQLPLGVPVFIT